MLLRSYRLQEISPSRLNIKATAQAIFKKQKQWQAQKMDLSIANTPQTWANHIFLPIQCKYPHKIQYRTVKSFILQAHQVRRPILLHHLAQMLLLCVFQRLLHQLQHHRLHWQPGTQNQGTWLLLTHLSRKHRPTMWRHFKKKQFYRMLRYEIRQLIKRYILA